MIDLFTLWESLKNTVILHRRNYLWSSRMQRTLAKQDAVFEETDEISLADALPYLQQTIKLEASIMLRDCGLVSVTLDRNSAPVAYSIFTSGDLESVLEGGSDDR